MDLKENLRPWSNQPLFMHKAFLDNLDHVPTIPDSFRAEVKIVSDRPSVHIIKVIFQHDFYIG